MNKNILQKFATEARTELKRRIKNKANQYGIKEDEIKKGQIESSDSIVIEGNILDKNQKEQRRKLIDKIEALNEEGSNGFDIVIEEVAYTWFNRLIALRFMEVNGYIKTRSLSSEEGNIVPDLVTEALDITFRNVDLDEEYIRNLKLKGDTDSIQKLFKYMIISQCNELHKSLPFMFETISDYTELLFPDGLLDETSFVSKMTDASYIPVEDWEEVEIIGWLYQYYIADEKDRVIKAKKKYKKEEIPYATQLFTPKWIVKYMVQNSLGRYWIESHPEDDELKKDWEFYLENPEKEPDFDEKIAPYINKELNVEDIKCFDPACGSGHILVYMFEVLYEIYSRVGYEEREIPRLIIENNLYGLDIDDRAYQLACFAVVMKGASYNKMLLRSIERDGIKLNIASIQETNNLNDTDIAYIAGERSGKNFNKTKKFVETFYNGKTYGSLIKVDEFDKEFFEERLDYINKNIAIDLDFQISKQKGTNELLEKLISQADIMIENYDILVTNPPYMGNTYMNDNLVMFLKENYGFVKSDTFSAFISYCVKKVKRIGHLGFLTPFVWFYISSYEKLRDYVLHRSTISSLIQLEYNAFPEACVPVGAFTLRNIETSICGEFINLDKFPGKDIQELKVLDSVVNKVDYRYTRKSVDFIDMPSKEFIFSVSDKAMEILKKEESILNRVECKSGIMTGKDKVFIKNWYEVNFNNIKSNCKSYRDMEAYRWFPICSGGDFRKYYGNNEYVVNLYNDGEDIKKISKNHRLRDKKYYFKKAITWSRISSSKIAFRVAEQGMVFGDAGPCMYLNNSEEYYYLLGYLNSNVSSIFLKALNPTMNFQVGDIENLPIKNVSSDEKKLVDSIVKEMIGTYKEEWDTYETSPGFIKNKLVNNTYRNNNIKELIYSEINNSKLKYSYLQEKGLELDEIFNKIYALNSYVDNQEITYSVNSEVEETKSFTSYAVGCMLGRYSLDQEGLVYAGGEFDLSKYTTFKADEDNIIPILDESYFEDDIVSRFIEFVKVTFGEESLKENIEYIATTLDEKNGKSNPKETIRKYFLTSFYKDHVQTYKKRPIYWLVTSGKQKAFNALIYMHRYDKNTLSRIRTDYVHPLQNKLDVEKSRAEEDLSLATKASEKTQINRKITKLDKQIDELKKFEETLHDFADKQIEIDLDDGVVYNYDLFKGLLAKI